MTISEASRRPAPGPRAGDGGLRRQDWTLVGLLWVVVTAANLGKPFHIDDVAHLEIARWINADPLHPMSGLLNWSGTLEPIFATNQPHLFFYVLAGWARVFGYSEVSLHLLQSVFAFAAIAVFHSIAVRLAPRSASWLTALLALGPAFVVEQNVMVDIALLAVWLAFFRVLLLGIDSANPTARYVAMASFASVALLIKYSSLVLVAVLVLALVLERRRSLAWVLLIPAGTLLAWSAFNVVDVGAVHVLSRPSNGLSVPHLVDSSYRWVITLGGMLPLGVMMIGVALRRRGAVLTRSGPLAVAAVVAFSLAVLVGIVPGPAADGLLLAVFLVNGLLMCAWLGLLVDGEVRSGPVSDLEPDRLVRTYLLTWVVATTAFYVLLGPFVAARHVLLILPPILLLFGRAFSRTATRQVLAVGLGATVVVSLGLGVSDWRFASFYRDAAKDVAATIPDGTRVWTSGHWGWQWYAQRQGMVQLDISKDLMRPGDYLVVADGVDHQLPRDLGRLEVAGRVEQESGPLSLLCTGRRARLYATSTFGPWSVSRECTGSVTVYRVLESSGAHQP